MWHILLTRSFFDAYIVATLSSNKFRVILSKIDKLPNIIIFILMVIEMTLSRNLFLGCILKCAKRFQGL